MKKMSIKLLGLLLSLLMMISAFSGCSSKEKEETDAEEKEEVAKIETKPDYAQKSEYIIYEKNNGYYVVKAGEDEGEKLPNASLSHYPAYVGNNIVYMTRDYELVCCAYDDLDEYTVVAEDVNSFEYLENINVLKYYSQGHTFISQEPTQPGKALTEGEVYDFGIDVEKQVMVYVDINNNLNIKKYADDEEAEFIDGDVGSFAMDYTYGNYVDSDRVFYIKTEYDDGYCLCAYIDGKTSEIANKTDSYAMIGENMYYTKRNYDSTYDIYYVTEDGKSKKIGSDFDYVDLYEGVASCCVETDYDDYYYEDETESSYYYEDSTYSYDEYEDYYSDYYYESETSYYDDDYYYEDEYYEATTDEYYVFAPNGKLVSLGYDDVTMARMSNDKKYVYYRRGDGDALFRAEITNSGLKNSKKLATGVQWIDVYQHVVLIDSTDGTGGFVYRDKFYETSGPWYSWNAYEDELYCTHNDSRFYKITLDGEETRLTRDLSCYKVTTEGCYYVEANKELYNEEGEYIDSDIITIVDADGWHDYYDYEYEAE